MLKIGYQGISGSNSEDAAKKFCEMNHFSDVELVPLVTSLGVVDKLNSGEIDYGVMAYKNNIGGKVKESMDALSRINYALIGRCELLIHHCIFVYDDKVDISSVTKVVSHEQALIQCQNYIQARFPDAAIIKSQDTAISAKQLKDGVLDRSTAIICKKSAGESRGLYLIDENIEDEESVTEFRMIKLGGFDLTNSTDIDKKTRRKTALYSFFSGIYCHLFLCLLCACLCLAGIVCSWIFVGAGIVLCILILVLLMRKYFLNKIPLSNTIGYWKYYSSAVSGLDPNQMHDFLRLAEIYQNSEGLHLKIWIGSDFTTPYVISTKILTTSNDCLNGSLIYWYTGTVNIQTNASITGVAVLEWNIESKNKQINSMRGWYLGSASKEIGALVYTRISKEEFNYIKNSRVMRI